MHSHSHSRVHVIEQKEGRYLLLVGAVPVDAVSLRSPEAGADARDQARNPNQIHGGHEETRCAEE